MASMCHEKQIFPLLKASFFMHKFVMHFLLNISRRNLCGMNLFMQAAAFIVLGLQGFYASLILKTFPPCQQMRLNVLPPPRIDRFYERNLLHVRNVRGFLLLFCRA